VTFPSVNRIHVWDLRTRKYLRALEMPAPGGLAYSRRLGVFLAVDRASGRGQAFDAQLRGPVAVDRALATARALRTGGAHLARFDD
jgi:hypothetical protein